MSDANRKQEQAEIDTLCTCRRDVMMGGERPRMGGSFDCPVHVGRCAVCESKFSRSDTQDELCAICYEGSWRDGDA